MATGRPLARLLLRGSLLLIATLTLWRLVLPVPLLAALRVCEDGTLRLAASASNPISVESSGDWTFRIPVAGAKIAAVEFSVSRSDLILFTFSLPLYCALALAVPVGNSGVRPLVYGAAAVFAIEVFSLLGFTEIMAQSVLSKMEPSAVALGPWPREFGTYLLTQVIPFAAPLLIMVACHRELRRRIFPRELSEPVPNLATSPHPSPPEPAARRKREPRQKNRPWRSSRPQ